MRIVFLAWARSEHTRRWVSFFAERGHETHVVTCGDGDPAHAAANGYHLHDLGPPRFGKAGYVAKIPDARRLVRSLEPDVVHAHYVTSYGLLALAAGCRPLVVTAHGSDVLVSPRNPLMRLLVQRVLRAASLITISNEHMRAPVEALLGRHEQPVLALQYGVDVAALVSLGDAARAGRDAGPTRIVSVRHLWPVYRIDLLIEALGLLHAEGFEFECEIAGAGPSETFEQRAAELDLTGRIRFHGLLAAERAEELMAGADVYVSVPDSDGLSISLLEALALGLVPVLSDIPANAGWVVDGTSGFVVEQTPESVAAGIRGAARVDRAAAVAANRAAVRERADRATNLGRLEQLLLELAATGGVSARAS